MSPGRTANDIYWSYACNRFFLDRDGMKEAYLALGGGDREQERIWRKEYIDSWILRLSADDREPLRWLMNANAVESIPALLGRKDYGDDFMKFWFAFALEHIARCEMPKETRNAAVAKAVMLWQEILDAPQGIDPAHRHEITATNLQAFGAHTAEEYIRNYTRVMLGRTGAPERYGPGSSPAGEETC